MNITFSCLSATSDATLNFVFAAMIIFANVTVSVALRYMRSAKKTTVVFLANLAISNLVQGIIFLLKGVFYIWHVNTVHGCIIMTIFSMATSGTYMTGIFFVYLDLYLSLKKMSVSKPVIPTHTALAMIVFAWVFWLAWGAVGYGMRNPKYKYNHQAGCSIINGAYTKEYILFICVTFMIGFVGILVFHLLTYMLINKAKKLQQQAIEAQNTTTVTTVSDTSQVKRTDSKKSKWLKKNDAVLNMILLVLIMFIICWYPLILITLLVAYCRPCLPYITNEVVYATYVLVITQYMSNGIIYLVKIREFKNAFKRLCCRCFPWYSRIQPTNSDMEVTATSHN